MATIARALTKRIKPLDDFHPISTNAPPAASNNPSATTATPTSPLARSVSAAARRIDRAQISLPVTLLSTTNALALEAPDLFPDARRPGGPLPTNAASASPASPAFFAGHHPRSPATPASGSARTPLSPLPPVGEAARSDTSSTRSSSADRSDASSAGPASTAASSVGSPVVSRETSPGAAGSPALPEPNHLSAYFPSAKPRVTTDAPPVPPAPKARKPSLETAPARAPPNVYQPRSAAASAPAPTPAPTPAPVVPGRSRTHTVETHQALARQRSQRSSPRMSLDAPRRASTEQRERAFADGVALDLGPSPAPTPEPHRPLTRWPEVERVERVAEEDEAPHPFGAELAQVQEVAKEFNLQDVRVWDEEERFLAAHGLRKFGAEDYIGEIVLPLFRGVFSPVAEPPEAVEEEEEETWL